MMKRMVHWLKDERGDVPQNLVVVGMWVAIGVVLTSALATVLRGRTDTLTTQIESISDDNFVAP